MMAWGWWSMPERRVTRQDFIRRRRQGGFIGRGTELAVFRDNLTKRPDQDETFQLLFHVTGTAGVGKSSLLREWEKIAREAKAVTAFIGDEVHDALEAMESIGAQMTRQDCTLKGFEKSLRDYRQRRTDIAASLATPTNPSPEASTSSTVAAQLLLTGLGTVPGVGAIAGAIDPGQVALSADRMRTAVSGRFGKVDDDQTSSPIPALTRPFVKDIGQAAERHPWIVLFIDSFESTQSFLNSWLLDVLFAERYEEIPLNVVVVLAGQKQLDDKLWGEWRDQVCQVDLNVFTEPEARSLLAAKGVTDEATVAEILRLSGRLPVLVSTLAQNTPQSPQALSDPAETAVERFLSREVDEVHRETVLACAYPLYLNEDIYHDATPEGSTSTYSWLCSLPFVSDQAGRRRYHDIVRSPMLRLQRQESPTKWRKRHLHLAGSFRAWREQLEREQGIEILRGWAIPQWREYRLSEMYHLLCANPRQYSIFTLQEAVSACAHGESSSHQWLQVIRQVAIDIEDARIERWCQVSTDALRNGKDPSSAILDLLAASPDLPDWERAFAHCIRGQKHFMINQYDEALREFSKSLKVDGYFLPSALARGTTLLTLGNIEAALMDFDYVIASDSTGELAPLAHLASLSARGTSWNLNSLTDSPDTIRDSSWYLIGRAEAMLASGQPADALADMDRLLIEDEYHKIAALMVRARALAALNQPDEALECLGDALKSAPDCIPILAMRSEILSSVGRLSEALEEIKRVLEINPYLPTALTTHGLIIFQMGRHEEALSSVNEALSIAPKFPMALSIRCAIHLEHGRVAEALADAEAALELSPGDIRGRVARAEALLACGRISDALADVEFVAATNPKLPIVLSVRARILLALGEADAALSDANEALAVDQNFLPALISRSFSLLLGGGDLQEALRDVERALEMRPDFSMALVARCHILLAQGETLKALSCINGVLEANGDYLPALGARWTIFATIDQPEKALADLNHALTINPIFVPALSERSQLLLSMGRPEEALMDLEKIEDIYPSIETREMADRVRIMLRLGEAIRPGHAQTQPTIPQSLERQLREAEYAALESPNDLTILQNQIDILVGLDRIDEALLKADELILRAPSRISARLSRSEILLTMGRADDAMEDLNYALQIDPNEVQALTNRGGIRQSLRDFDGALKDLTRALELSPDDEWVSAAHADLLSAIEQEGNPI